MRKHNDFLALLCHLYLIGMTVFLPLYTGGTFSDLGDTKYVVFRNLTVLCLGIWLAALALEGMEKGCRRCAVRILRFRYRCKRADAVWSPGELGAQKEAVCGVASGEGRLRSDSQGENPPENCRRTFRQRRLQSRRENQSESGMLWESMASFWASVWRRMRRSLSVTDLFMLLYGGAVVLSAVCSQYEGTPWTGYREWYMGAVSQLLFVGIYFFVSRCYDGRKFAVLFGAGGFFLVTLFGILHRLGVDPLGLLKDFNTGDWTYSHMLSTVGNINWFCGYASVALALPVACFLKSKSGWQRIAFYIVSVAGLFLLFIQGSDIGVILTAVCLLVCLVWGLGDATVFRRTFLLLAGMSFLLPCYGRLAAFLGQSALAALPADSVGWRVIGSDMWWIVGAGALGLWFLLREPGNEATESQAAGNEAAENQTAGNEAAESQAAENEVTENQTAGNEAAESQATENQASGRQALEYGIWAGRTRRIQAAAVALLFLALAGGAVFFLVRQPAGEMWGSGRGALWRTSLQGFRQNGLLRKLIGVGPDCFAEYIYSTFTREAFPALEGRWAGTVYANAHNEWLNHLVNLGIMGTGLYLGIFISGAARYRGNLSGILALAMYGAVSLTGFQQCMSTPLLFLLLGICESGLRCVPGERQDERTERRGKPYEMDEIQDQDGDGCGGYCDQHPL